MKSQTSSILAALLAAALIVRLIFGLAQDPVAPFERQGGDSWWYLVNGDALVSGRSPDDVKVDPSRLPTPPGYLLLLGGAQALFGPSAGAVIAVRVVQAALSTLICWCGWRIAYRLTGREAVGLLAALILTVSPAFIIESASILSETLYMALLALGLTASVELIARALADPQRAGALRQATLAGAWFGLAALTRAPILLFPVGVAIHLLIVFGLRRGWRHVLVLLVVYAAVVSTWTFYNAARWGRWVIAADGFAAFLYVGATGWEGPQAVDERLGSTDGGASDQQFIDAAAQSITADPLAYVRRRSLELVEAFLQPHGTVFFGGESLRDLALRWLREDRSLDGLLAVFRADAFAQKALLYIFHFGALFFGMVGMWRTRRNWRISLILIGVIVYTLLVHLFLLALPRYLFPTALCWILFAAAALPANLRYNNR